MTIYNLEKMLERACPIDLNEGMLAYERYNIVMNNIAECYKFSLEKVIAVFVSLSPNNDYKGNLRSTVSVLDGINKGLDVDDITVSTYGHCKKRAYAYALGHREFLNETKGPKIWNFYHNVLTPKDTRYVTIDGHMSAIWQNKELTMREALIPISIYRIIRNDTIQLAFKHFMIPNQMQAVLWFVRKRISNVVYDPQMKLFGDATDVWETMKDLATIPPFSSRKEQIKIASGENYAVPIQGDLYT